MSESPVPASAPASSPSAAALREKESLALARRVAALVVERRATDVVLLDVRSLVDYTDFFLVASGTSGRQNQTIGEHVVRTLKQDRLLAISKSGLDTGSWICLDLGDVVVHVFDPETRARYDLELLWADAPRADLVETPAETSAADAAPAADESPAGDEAEAAPAKPARRRRAVRKAAVEDADADNAPAGARPPLDEPEPEAPLRVHTPRMTKRAKPQKPPAPAAEEAPAKPKRAPAAPKAKKPSRAATPRTKKRRSGK
jgi:ribosome-associated protein